MEIETSTETAIYGKISEVESTAEYKTQIGGQPNPFENVTPTEINDRPVEDYSCEGEDGLRVGNHF